ncbi:PIN domain-containing protein [Pseudomonas atacamensis]|uniref:PIN domain-containing protein n=1 Tax=Pseudomonas atacamensis TaxID=2565368 RepID=UPI0024803F24|nr:PIN domain-containing protein [Pseudomonas atacamensis]WGT34681.1 PIN domain-containing protein [Pseudomonas atacamensis]
MKIYVDTNIFYNDWFMRQSNFRYFFHYIANENEELLISKVVCEEVENIRRREALEAIQKIKNELKSLTKLLPQPLAPDLSTAENFEFDFIEHLEDRCDNLELLEYEEVSHREVVARALTNKKPFSDGEKGYRDTLIWLSLVHHLKKTKYKGEVVFLTNNTSDFFEKKGSELALHKDLVSDLNAHGITANIRPCDSLFSFVRDHVEKNENLVNNSFVNDILIAEGCNFFRNISAKELVSVLDGTRLAGLPLQNLIFSDVDVMEGLEDEHLESGEELGKSEVFLSYTFNIRILEIWLEVPKLDYVSRQSDFDREFYEVTQKDNSVLLQTFIRPYFNISFIYNTQNDSYKDVSIACRRLR